MRILLTGGTGFVGSHIAVALMDAGHDVRLLARRPAQVPVTFAPHARSVDEVVVGDILDPRVVETAITGCDAVVHAAAVFSFDPRRAREMLDTNAQAARLVLGSAVDQDCDPVVHISSTVALVRHGPASPVSGDLPLGDMTLPYSRSKIASEEVARHLQTQGAPVVTVYPGAVYGPLDPHYGEQTRRLAWLARGLFPLWPRGGMHVCDVRDTAALVAATLETGQGPRRYVVPGSFVTGKDLYGSVSAALGHRRPFLSMPPWMATGSTRSIDALQSHLPDRWRYPADREGAEIAVRNTAFDTSPAETEMGVRSRPFAESVRDTLTWMVEAGHLEEKYRPRAGVPTP